MIRLAAPAALLATLLAGLAACTDAPAPTPVGEVTFNGRALPVEATAPGRWRVMVDGVPVPCSRPDERACYWSLRAWQQSQALLDDLG
ncbi:MAG: hypothetical protein H6895_14170 [Defluviimonas sp.]|uniref:hypothetical protein n=1 Tax=Albidovulum sp. TaxID=1872424 RepID=UPI001DE6F6B5|nr:hypothetical protein [Paracoccaceae bacterium]MCC0065209.1 hypothetical protein [Defluviimonas sp.]